MFWLNLTIGSVSDSKVLSKHQLADVEDLLESSNDLDNHFNCSNSFISSVAILNHFTEISCNINSNNLKDSEIAESIHGNCTRSISYCIWRI